MATLLEKRTINAAGLVQGIALVTFPAASTIFTAPDAYDLSSAEYGAMFLPQVITAVGASLLGTTLTGHFGIISFGQEKLRALSGAVAGGVAHGRPSPASLHPRPASVRATTSP